MIVLQTRGPVAFFDWADWRWRRACSGGVPVYRACGFQKVGGAPAYALFDGTHDMWIPF